jgi:hypothetical protein
MRPLASLPDEVAAGIDYVFADIDDTLTTDGLLPAETLSAIESLVEAGIIVVPVTGRPAGWCDMIARFWPVAGVVGENGAFFFSYDRDRKVMERVYAAPLAERQSNRARLVAVRDRILREVPGTAVSSDQNYRENDLAIDFCEDVPALTQDDVRRIHDIFVEEGAIAKISSIHVNGWFGGGDKLSMSRRFAEHLGIAPKDLTERAVFVGDSPNDAPMFGFFPHACGVANVADFGDLVDPQPAYVTQGRAAAGFAELAAHLLTARARRFGRFPPRAVRHTRKDIHDGR